MANVIPHIFFTLALTLSVILFGVTVFAFSAPLPFSKWFTPWHFLTRIIFNRVPERWDKNFALMMGGFCLVLLMSLCFSLGSFFVRAMSV